MPQPQVYLGFGSIKEIRNILREYSPKSIFLVTGKNSYQGSGAKSKLAPILKNYQVVIFNDFSINPKVEDIKRGILIYQKDRCDFTIAVGGGSVIDIAKSVNILVRQEGNPIDYVVGKKNIKYRGTPLVAIPTTAGSGSEATHFAVIYIDKIKYSLGHPVYMLPEVAIIDPDLTQSLPLLVTASCGLDVLSHGIEAFWSIHSTSLSDRWAEKAIGLALNNLPLVVNHPNQGSRLAMSTAAFWAGKAINLTKTTAAHAVSYPLTSYFNIPHGQAVAITLPLFIEFNCAVSSKDVQDRRGVRYVKNKLMKLLGFLGTKKPVEAKEILFNLIKMIGLEYQLSKLGINKEGIKIIIKNGFNRERIINNPRFVTKRGLEKLLLDIF